MNRYMNHERAAEYLGLSKGWLYKICRHRRVPYGKRGNAIIYDRLNLDQWLELCRKNIEQRSYGLPHYLENNEMPRYLTHKQASQYLGITKDALYQLVKREEIPAGRWEKGIIYDREKLDEWVDRCHQIRGVTLTEAVETDLKKGNLF